jgi:sec-independent protein translocase protein TatC
VTAKRRRPSNFQRAQEGSMTLIEHLRELRSRLFKASLAILAATIVGLFVSRQVLAFMQGPYCDYMVNTKGAQSCQFNLQNPLDVFMLNLKIALYLGLIGAGPIWLYQLWAFIAPGLHRRERKFGYIFAAIATPLFATGFALGYYMMVRSLPFLLGLGGDGVSLTVNLPGYFELVTSVMLIFGLGFEFPLVIGMLNFAGVVSARRLLSWWRTAVFLTFLFAAIFTPTPEPFSMTILALAMSALYFAAVGIAFLNDRRRARRAVYQDLNDDEASPIEPVSPVDAPTWGVPYGPDDDQQQR